MGMGQRGGGWKDWEERKKGKLQSGCKRKKRRKKRKEGRERERKEGKAERKKGRKKGKEKNIPHF